MADDRLDRENQEEGLRRNDPQDPSSRFEESQLHSSGRLIDLDRLPNPTPTSTEEETAQQEQSSQQPNRFQQGIDAGRQRATDAAKDYVGDKVKAAAKKAVGKVAKKIASQAISKAASLALAATSEVWGPILLVIVGLGLLLIIAVLALSTISGGDVQASGTSTTQSFDQTSNVDIAALKTTIAGGVNSVEKAKAVLVETAKLRPLLAGNAAALAILDSIDSAANAIIANPTDTAIVTAKSKVISDKIKELSSLLGANGNCNGATFCLNVPGVKQLSGGHCGTASITMVILYLTNGVTGGKYYDRAGNQTIRHNPLSCPLSDTINANAPAGRGGWVKAAWAPGPATLPNLGKERILSAVKKSLAAGDPVVMFFNPGGIYAGRKHIVAVVGYDQRDDTFYINDPKPGDVRPKVNTTGGGKLLTSEHVSNYLGSGPGSPYYSSVEIRRIYLEP